MYRQAQEVNVAVEGRARDHVLFEQRIEGVMFDVAVNVVSLELWGGCPLTFERIAATSLPFAGGVEQAHVQYTFIQTLMAPSTRRRASTRSSS